MATQATQTRPLSAYGMTVPLTRGHKRGALAQHAGFARASRMQHMQSPSRHAIEARCSSIFSLSNSPQPVLFTHPESTHDRAHVSIMRTCSDACLKAGRLRTYTKKDQPGQREHHRAQPTPLPYAGRSAAHQLASEGTHSSSTRSWFCTRFETRTGA